MNTENPLYKSKSSDVIINLLASAHVPILYLVCRYSYHLVA